MKKWFVVIALLAAQGCRKEPVTTAPESTLITRGRGVYQSNCIICHNVNPKLPGVMGPEVWGSSRELLEARILRGEYPQGYQPKRTTQAMAKLPQLNDEIDALQAYLNSNF